MPVPIDLSMMILYRKSKESNPFINKTANINVEIPVIISPIIIKYFLLYLSPHVPENIETKI